LREAASLLRRGYAPTVESTWRCLYALSTSTWRNVEEWSML
jgi:hypothetical protein